MTTTDTPRAEAVAWLVGRLRFERLLADLHQRADAAGAPVAIADEPPAVRKAA